MSLLNFLFRDRQKGSGSLQAEPDAAESASLPSTPVPASPDGSPRGPSKSERKLEPTIKAATAVAEPPAPAPEARVDPPAPPQAALPKRPAHPADLSDSDLATIMKPSATDIPDLDQIREALNKIAEIINDDERPQEDYSSGDFTTVDMRLAQVAELIPNVFPQGKAPAGKEDTLTGVVIEDLYVQLGKGKVLTTVGRMVGQIDEDLLLPDYGRFLRDEVSIPLNMVVTSVRPDELKKRTSHEERDPDLENLPNLFSRPGLETAAREQVGEPAPPLPTPPPVPQAPVPQAPAPPPPPAVAHEEDPIFGRPNRGETHLQAPPGRLPFYTEDETEEAEPPVSETPPDGTSGFAFQFDDSTPVFKMAGKGPAAPTEEPPAAAEEPPPAPEPAPPVPAVPSIPAAEPPPAADGSVLLRGVDLNQAAPADLAARLDGVGQRLAERIVRFRDQNGPFHAVSDLASVPGVGPTTYEKITGNSWTIARDSVRRAIDYVLGTDVNEMPDLRKVAHRLGDLSGVQGCIFTHQDGYTLAENWDNPSSEVLAVVAPQIFKKMVTYAEQLDLGELNPTTLFVGEYAISVVQSGDIYLSMIHSAGKMGKRHVRLLQLIGAELDVRLEKSKPTF